MNQQLDIALVKILVKVQPVACVKFARKVALLVLKLGRDVEEDIAVFFGVFLEQPVVVVDVFVGQVGHLLVLPAGHRQNRLDDDAAVGGNAGQLVNQQVILLHELLLGHQGDGVDAKGNHQTVWLALFDRLFDGEPVAVGTQLDERVVADGLLGAAVDGEHLFRWKQLVGQQTVGAAVADEGGFTQVILGVDLVDVGSRFGCGALLGRFRVGKADFLVGASLRSEVAAGQQQDAGGAGGKQRRRIFFTEQ